MKSLSLCTTEVILYSIVLRFIFCEKKIFFTVYNSGFILFNIFIFREKEIFFTVYNRGFILFNIFIFRENKINVRQNKLISASSSVYNRGYILYYDSFFAKRKSLSISTTEVILYSIVSLFHERKIPFPKYNRGYIVFNCFPISRKENPFHSVQQRQFAGFSSKRK